MMREEHHILGLNPVCDIYYDHEKFLAYRTKIVFGKDVSQLRKEWGVELTSWSAFFHAFISVINFLTSHGYGLPDLYTKGNFLYQEANQQLVVIDNDGIQVKKSFTDIVDHIALETSLRDSYANYYNPIDNYFTNQYNAFAFYSWFYFYFFDVRLPFYLGEDTKFIKQVLRECGIQLNPWLWESTLDLFSNHPCTYIDEALFSDLAKDFKIDDHSRTLMYR